MLSSLFQVINGIHIGRRVIWLDARCGYASSANLKLLAPVLSVCVCFHEDYFRPD